MYEALFLACCIISLSPHPYEVGNIKCYYFTNEETEAQ